jgi:hypothetical protein
MSIFQGYKSYFNDLTAKGFKPKLNIIDNQGTKHIKFFYQKRLQTAGCQTNNHHVNAAKRTIQTFKAAFIAALAATDSNFPLQLWDKLTPQVQDTLNMLRASQIDPTKSAYEIFNGPCNWNQYPLVPLGCKAAMYKDGDIRGLWASRGVDAFNLGPSKDHYRCDLNYVLETRAYCVSGSAELFPQHCQLPSMTPHQHFRTLTDELTKNTALANMTSKGRQLLKLLGGRLTSCWPRHLPWKNKGWQMSANTMHTRQSKG